MDELKRYFYENLYVLKDEKLTNYDSIEKIKKEEDLKGVCDDCDKTVPCKLMSGYSSSDDLMKLWENVLTTDELNDFKERRNDNPRVMFILENPGQDWWGKLSKEDKIQKTVSYDSLNYWFSKESDFKNKKIHNFPNKKESLYAFAFTHLIYKYGFGNIHITNSVKCKPKDAVNMNNYPANNLHCMLKFLKTEIQYFKPDIILCFGGNAFNNLNLLITKDNEIQEFLNHVQIKKLHHPSFRGKALMSYKEQHNVANLYDALKRNWHLNIEAVLKDNIC